jgi:hypothetical protein
LRAGPTRGQLVLEVDWPNRPPLRRRSRSDPADAEAAGRAVLARTATAQPEAGDGPVEMVRAVHVAATLPDGYLMKRINIKEFPSRSVIFASRRGRLVRRRQLSPASEQQGHTL